MSEKITIENGNLIVPDKPVIPFIEGDGTGPDIWNASVRVFDAAVEKAYGGSKKIEWLEVLAGEKAFNQTGDWLPQATLDAFKDYLVGIKGPLTTPVGGGIRSLNVALRQILDLYVCLRPVRWFEGVPSPVKRPELTDMVIFRENAEDIYAGIEFENGTPECDKLKALLKENFPKLFGKIRFPDTTGLGIGGRLRLRGIQLKCLHVAVERSARYQQRQGRRPRGSWRARHDQIRPLLHHLPNLLSGCLCQGGRTEFYAFPHRPSIFPSFDGLCHMPHDVVRLSQQGLQLLQIEGWRQLQLLKLGIRLVQQTLQGIDVRHHGKR